MADSLPKLYEQFKEEFPEVFNAYQKLGDSCHEIGALDEKERRLIKLGIAIGLHSEGAVHAQVRRASQEGFTEKQIKQVALLAIPTIGFPRAMAALSWIKDLL